MYIYENYESVLGSRGVEGGKKGDNCSFNFTFIYFEFFLEMYVLEL